MMKRLRAKKGLRSGRIFTLVFCAVWLSVPAVSHAGGACPGDPPMEKLALPHLRAAVAGRMEGVIVALGSSSTEGAMASDSAHTYPAILQAALNKALPAAHFAVINRGIGGQDAPEELARLDTDVIAVRPQLVIWQVGANGAMRHADPAEFHTRVQAGVERLVKAGIDVILMDNQRSPRVLAAVDHIVLEDSLARVARETDASLFSRSHLMDAWSEEGAKPGMFIASDGLHQNDLGYLCVTQALARQIVTAVSAPVSVSASR
ncbi:MAG TPA: SGNH/GDSL hydrolase family protein [Rhodopila sp.]|jgi:lysophospholipase L1-like esterase|nr:SGNH/GDSL hydrolase family protein [Rhodopila sp.]